jgi:hypothetical protein
MTRLLNNARARTLLCLSEKMMGRFGTEQKKSQASSKASKKGLVSREGFFGKNQ